MNIYDLVRNPRDYSIEQLQAMSMIIESVADCLDVGEDEYYALLNCVNDFNKIMIDKLRDMFDHAMLNRACDMLNHADSELKVVYDNV